MHDEVVFVHFNDVYHLSDPTLVARFATFLNRIDITESPVGILRIFSGDVFSPSLEASVLSGEHMTTLLNNLNIDVACYGNHDFDFGETRLIELSKQTKFPWTLTKAVRNDDYGSPTQTLLASAQEYVVRKVGPYRIGFFGLAGSDWPSNCQHLPKSTIIDPPLAARSTAKLLRTKETCDFVVALTHMRLVEDLAVSKATESRDERVDLLLGGHDHHVVRRFALDNETNPDVIQQGCVNENITKAGEVMEAAGNIEVVKSGSDWTGLSIVRLCVSCQPDGSATLHQVKLKQIVNLRDMPLFRTLEPSASVLNTLRLVEKRVASMVKQPLLHTSTPLDGRSQIIRSQETNLGNMLADAVRAFFNTDIAFVNSGSIRCNKIVNATHETKGQLSIRDVIEICPFDNAFVVKSVSGNMLLTAPDNSVSDAHVDGRFFQVSGLNFKAAWNRPEGQRLLNVNFVPLKGPSQAIRPERLCTVDMVNFIASGFDGYTCFKDASTLVEEEGGMTDTSLLLAIFGAPSQAANGSADSTDSGLLRARDAIFVGHNEADGLPIVKPQVEGRILLTNSSSE